MPEVKRIQPVPTPPPPDLLQVTLTVEEAAELVHVLRNVGGSGPHRESTDRLLWALRGRLSHVEKTSIPDSAASGSIYWQL